jgi:hypothetical protein
MAAPSSTASLPRALTVAHQDLQAPLDEGICQFKGSLRFGNAGQILLAVGCFVDQLCAVPEWRAELERRAGLFEIDGQPGAEFRRAIDGAIDWPEVKGAHWLYHIQQAENPSSSSYSRGIRTTIEGGAAGGGMLQLMRDATDSLVAWVAEHPGAASQTTRWERLKQWAWNNRVVVVLLAIGAVVPFLVALGSGLGTLFNWARRFIVWLWQ